ncbi:MAG: FAD-binding oxidoreductase [SAR202 cluster bacterium]|nr:FAD-binding oxidoreductase [SAR202 cluster bacterium]
MERTEIAIVGGGAIGCATAYYLAKEGADVTLIESSGIAGAASGFAMGLLSPLSGAGIPGPLEELCRQGFFMHREMAGELRDATGVDYHAEPRDSIYLASTEQEAKALGVLARYSQSIDGVTTQWVDTRAVLDMEPRVSPEVHGGLLVRGTWILEAYDYTMALSRAAELGGVKVTYGKVRGLKRALSGCQVLMDVDAVEAKKVVLAMGPWMSLAQRWLGMTIPIYPLKGQILRVDLPGGPMRCTIHDENGNYAGSKPDGLVWAGTTEEQVGFDDEPTQAARARILREVSAFLPAIKEANVVKQTACLRPVSTDGLPIIGEAPGWKGVYLCTGAGRKGIILSPSMGLATAELVMKGQSRFALDMFSPARFASTSPTAHR